MRLSRLHLPRFCGPVVLSTVCLAALPAAADTYTWSKTVAGTYAWPDPANWGGAGFPNATNDVANLNIDIAGNINVSLNTNVTVGVLNVGDSSGTSVVTLQHGTGTRTLVFAQTSGNAQLNGIGAGAPTISANIRLDSPLDLTAAANFSLSGVISANGQTFTRAVGGGAGQRLFISGNNSFANVAIRDGTVFISGINTFAPGSTFTIDLASYGLVLTSMRGLGQGSANLPTLVLTKGIFQPSGPLFPLSNPMTINGDVQIGNSSFGGAMIHDGAVNLSGGTRTLSTSYGNAVIASPLELYVTDYANFAGAISNGGVIKASRSGMAFSGSNTYAGNTRITAGGLLLGQAASLPAAGTLQLRCGATVDQGVLVTSGRFYANQTWDRALGTGAGQFNWNDGATSSGGGFGAFADDLDDAGGDLIVALGAQKWGVAPFISAGDIIFGALLSNRKVIWTGNIDLAGAARTISAIRGYGKVPPAEIRGNLTTSSGTASLQNNANATGLIILSGTNTYNGTTTVSGNTGAATVAGGLRIAHPLALPGGNLIFGGGVLEGSTAFASWTNGLGTIARTVRWSRRRTGGLTQRGTTRHNAGNQQSTEQNPAKNGLTQIDATRRPMTRV